MESSGPFEELPEVLVEDLLKSCSEISDNLSKNFKEINNKKEEFRKKLKDKKWLNNSDELLSAPSYPTSCGIDGSYSTEKLVSTDISAVAAVAVEGLTPPGPEKRKWPRPRHFSDVQVTKHSEGTSLVLRGIMMNMETHLALNAPHEVIFFDNSLATPFIYFHEAINKARSKEAPENLIKVFMEGKDQKNEDNVKFPGLVEGFKAYKEILSSPRSDKIYAGIPKYSTQNYVCNFLGCPNFEDRGLLNFIMNKGEFIGPLNVGLDGWHFPDVEQIKEFKNEIISLLKDIQIIYYKPSEFFPVIRLEVSSSIAKNKNRLAILFESLNIQCITPAIMEPYPNYLADRMVKHLSRALPSIRNAATQDMILKWEGDIGTINISMQGYRTEHGR